MILVDTSIWADHLQHGDEQLTLLLLNGEVLMHRYVMGEVALGNLPKRAVILGRLAQLPEIPVASPDEVLVLIESSELAGSGIGYVDAHLLASAGIARCRLRPGTSVSIG